jgi:hypothetical protein
MWCAFALPNVFWGPHLLGRLHLWLLHRLAMRVAMPMPNMGVRHFSMGINHCDKHSRDDKERFQ